MLGYEYKSKEAIITPEWSSRVVASSTDLKAHPLATSWAKNQVCFRGGRGLILPWKLGVAVKTVGFYLATRIFPQEFWNNGKHTQEWMGINQDIDKNRETVHHQTWSTATQREKSDDMHCSKETLVRSGVNSQYPSSAHSIQHIYSVVCPRDTRILKILIRHKTMAFPRQNNWGYPWPLFQVKGLYC